LALHRADVADAINRPWSPALIAGGAVNVGAVIQRWASGERNLREGRPAITPERRGPGAPIVPSGAKNTGVFRCHGQHGVVRSCSKKAIASGRTAVQEDVEQMEMRAAEAVEEAAAERGS